ncbi:hypothetical protein [Enterococcus faecalis]|uniref:hypothetical protein n=1 Tax=Enterococcus faecalis TaxID=1351 RepID=UPI002224D75F|nr:hypothetical protein [Enterococcus faecalis]UYY27365.1 hypothetical protein OLL90_11960 [Enterococcus faecalis]
MKKKVFLALTIFAMVTPFIFSSEASAREAEFGSSCPGGFYFKKGGWSTGGKKYERWLLCSFRKYGKHE